eukprot:scaffold163125_cov34-Prasinocladus_malaysianus.AAC.1
MHDGKESFIFKSWQQSVGELSRDLTSCWWTAVAWVSPSRIGAAHGCHTYCRQSRRSQAVGDFV